MHPKTLSQVQTQQEEIFDSKHTSPAVIVVPRRSLSMIVR